MKIRCEYCDSWINDFDKVCKNCGGTNANFKRQANGTPATIEELKEWALKKNLPLKDMRTYIGENYKGAKAFGIYKDEKTGNFIVYKNKADGSRSVRYEGPDEAYAVNELYQKMKERIAEQKQHMTQKNSKNTRKTAKNQKGVIRLVVTLYIIFVVVIVLFSCIRRIGRADTGYYNYGNSVYYHSSHNNWYIWQNDDWYGTTVPDELNDNYESYYESAGYTYDVEYGDFSTSDSYQDELDSYSDSDDDWDSDWDSSWDSSDSWDSSWDSWDSDW